MASKRHYIAYMNQLAAICKISPYNIRYRVGPCRIKTVKFIFPSSKAVKPLNMISKEGC